MSAKSIMIQGTMSSAGKSFITAGLCRIFYQDGLHTVPFKSQNMALNSYITKDGLEMGRAQVMQAEASGVEPDIRMNPILLKPTSDRGSQVIVDGEIFGTMTATEYYKKKQELIPHIMKSYRSLAEDMGFAFEGFRKFAARIHEAERFDEGHLLPFFEVQPSVPSRPDR